MICGGCGNKDAYRYKMRNGVEYCNACANLGALAQPDAYFRGPYLDTNLVDVNDPKGRDGTFITSKRHKVEVMKKLGVREVGDRVGGARKEDKALQRSDAQSRRK